MSAAPPPGRAGPVRTDARRPRAAPVHGRAAVPPPPGHPVVCAPLAVERAALSGALPGTRVLRTGMGPDRAAATAARLAVGGPRPVLVAGVAGALVPGLRAGDLVVADEVRFVPAASASAGGGTTGARVVRVPTAAPLAAALRRLGLRVHVGPIVTTDAVVDGELRAALAASLPPPVHEGLPPSVHERRRRADLPDDGAVPASTEDPAGAAVEGGDPDGTGTDGERPALAVDMESAVLAAAAAGGPFAVVRAVVDTPENPLARAGTARRGLVALRALRRAAPALQQWLSATGEREVLLAEPRSFCAGVERAIDIVDRALDRYGAPVYVRRQIVHNAHVVRRLAGRGAVFVTELDEVPEGSTVVLAAHGVSPAVRAQAEERRLAVVDATCPLVAKVHAEVKRHTGRGRTVFLIGHADHEEVEGTVGEAPERVVVVEDEATARTVVAEDPERVAYAMQTTLATDEAERIAAVLRARFPAITAPRSDDICYATTNRQRAIRAVAADADLVLVVGSPNSSNSRRLAEVAARAGAPAHLLDDMGELDLGWLAGVRRIGISAGASAPPELVDELVTCLSGLGPVTATTASVGTEDIRFTLPKEVS